MALSTREQEREERYTHLLHRHYVITDLLDRRHTVTDIVSYVLALARDPQRALALFERSVGYRREVSRMRPCFEEFFIKRYRSAHEYFQPGPDQHYFIHNEQVFYYPYFWHIALLNGNPTGELRDALHWYITTRMTPRKTKRYNYTRRRPVYGGYRSMRTLSEIKAAAAHCEEYGETIVRPARRAHALPTGWDDVRQQVQRCWKSQRKTPKQWQR